MIIKNLLNRLVWPITLVVTVIVIFIFVNLIRSQEEARIKSNEEIRKEYNEANEKIREEHKEEYKEEEIITGIIEDIKPINLDNDYVLLLIFFKDGRIIQLRTFPGNCIVFHKNKVNIITYSRIRRSIYDVKLKDTKKLKVL